MMGQILPFTPARLFVQSVLNSVCYAQSSVPKSTSVPSTHSLFLLP